MERVYRDDIKTTILRGDMLSAMLKYATSMHHGQFDKSGVPYILHPIAVMTFLNTYDEELQCIALGHDLIEDTEASYTDLQKIGMTERIREGIRCLTKIKGEEYEDYKARVFSNKDAVRVKLCDIQHNTDLNRVFTELTDKDITRIKKYQAFRLELKERLRMNYV